MSDRKEWVGHDPLVMLLNEQDRRALRGVSRRYYHGHETVTSVPFKRAVVANTSKGPRDKSRQDISELIVKDGVAQGPCERRHALFYRF